MAAVPDETPAPGAPAPGDAAAGPSRSDRPGRAGRAGRRATGGGALKVLAIVVAIVVVAELFTRFISGYLLPPQSNGAGEANLKYDQVKDFAASGGLDLVVIGDSMTDAGIDPTAVAGATARFRRPYNASLRGARLPAQRVWAFDKVFPQTRPALVLQGVSPTLVSNLGASPTDLGAFDTMLTNNLRALDPDVWQQLDQQLSDNLYLARYRASLRSPRIVGQATWDKLTGNPATPAVDRGPAYWKAITNPDGQNTEYAKGTAHLDGLEPLFAAIKTLLDGGEQYAPFDALLDGYKAAKIPTVVVIPPVATDLLRQAGVDVSLWRQSASRIADHARAKGVAVLDFTDRAYPTEWFYDPFHLNGPGSRQFSSDLGAALAERCKADASLGCG